MDHKKSKKIVSIAKHHHRHHKCEKHRPKYVNISDYIDFSFTLIGAPRITLGQRTQEELECVAGKDVTSDHPWKFVAKELLMDSITYNYESELLPLRLDISIYPRDPLLLVYIPDEMRDHDEFVLCLTEETEDKIAKNINRFHKAIQGILERALYRSARPWKSLGSEKEIEERPDGTHRLIVDVEAAYPLMFRKIQLRRRRAEDVRDGYVELLQRKPAPPQVSKMLQTIGVQAAPRKHDGTTQTSYKYKRNVATQYIFEYQIPPTLKQNSFTSDFICDQVATTSKINFYTNDYLQLKKTGRYMKPPRESKDAELITFSEFSVAKDKLISSVCWHPILTGTVAIAYSHEASNVCQSGRPKLDRLQSAEHEVNTVLIWCTNDELHPKLRLVCSKKITSVSFCPFNENVVVGACTNGQIVLWDIRKRLEQVEEINILTDRERTHRVFMSLFMDWTKDVHDKSRVSVTAESDLRYSHSWPAVSIQWLPPYCRINEFGELELVPEDEPESMQLVTCALDGSIFFWDLLAKQTSHERYMGFQKTSRNLARPSALVMATSPFRVLNRTLRPIYKLNSTSSKKMKPLLTTAIITPPVAVAYEQGTKLKLDLTERVAFDVNVKRPPSVEGVKLEINCGTCDGYFFKAKWKGCPVSQGGTNNINQEMLTPTSIGRYHDGPVTSISRHPDLHDIYLTVGGKVFAIWTDNLEHHPVFWRKSRQKYLHGVWESVTFQCVILSTDDGRKEVWVLTRRSDTFYFEQHLSGHMVLGIYMYPFTLGEDEFLGVAHRDGTFGMIFVPGQLKQLCYRKDSLLTFLKREIERKKSFTAWQEKWNENHQGTVRKRAAEINIYKQEKLLKQKREEERRRETELQREEEEKRLLAQKRTKPRPGQYFKYAREQWRIREEENTRRTLQARARLPNRELLEKLQEPLEQIRKEEEKLQRKLKTRLQNSEKIFQETVAMMFPTALKKEPPPLLDPYAGGDTVSVKNECIFAYLSDAKAAEKYMEKNPYECVFRWDDLLQINTEKRASSIYLGTKSHRERRFHQKIMKHFEEVEI